MIGKRRFAKRIKCILVFLLALLLVWVALDIRMRPLVREYAINQARVMTSEAMALAVDTVLANGAYSYEELTSVKRTDEGAVLSVEADTAMINRFGADVITALGQALSQDRYTQMTVPLFSATGSAFLAGRGPQMRMRIQQNGAVTTKINSSFSAAGINQTIHRLELTLTFRVVVLVAGMSEPIETTGTFLVAETVIVGTVPDRYVGIETGR